MINTHISAGPTTPHIAPVNQPPLHIYYTPIIAPYIPPIALYPITPYALDCAPETDPYYTPTIGSVHARSPPKACSTPIALDTSISYPTQTPHIDPACPTQDTAYCMS